MNKTPQSSSEKLRLGLNAFNRRMFYEAHEYFEDAWRETPGSEREFYRSLLHLTGGFFRLTEGRPTAARKFFRRAGHWLAAFTHQMHGISIQDLQRYINTLLNLLDQGIDSTEILRKHFDPIQQAPMEE